MSRTIAVHVRHKSLYISLPFSAIHQVLRIFENLGHDVKYFGFHYGIDRWHYIFSLSRFLDRFALWTGLVTYEIREENLNPFFARCRPWPSSVLKFPKIFFLDRKPTEKAMTRRQQLDMCKMHVACDHVRNEDHNTYNFFSTGRQGRKDAPMPWREVAHSNASWNFSLGFLSTQ